MAKKEKSKLAALVKEWEKAQPYSLDSLVIRTAAHLSKIRDVPQTVLSGLDALAREDCRCQATYVDEVLRFLRSLMALEKMVQGKAADSGIRVL